MRPADQLVRGVVCSWKGWTRQELCAPASWRLSSFNHSMVTYLCQNTDKIEVCCNVQHVLRRNCEIFTNSLSILRTAVSGSCMRDLAISHRTLHTTISRLCPRVVYGCTASQNNVVDAPKSMISDICLVHKTNGYRLYGQELFVSCSIECENYDFWYMY
jgi:hypothetical protein